MHKKFPEIKDFAEELFLDGATTGKHYIQSPSYEAFPAQLNHITSIPPSLGIRNSSSNNLAVKPHFMFQVNQDLFFPALERVE